MEREIRQLHAGKEEDRKLIIELQEKVYSLQQQHESFKASAAKSDKETRYLLQQVKNSREKTEKCEDKINDHGERITDLERHRQLKDAIFVQHG